MTNYEGLTKIANYVGPNDIAATCLPVHADVQSAMFFAVDLFALILEVAGGVMIAKADRDPQKYKYGQRVSFAGMVIQAGAIIAFSIILILFGVRVAGQYPDRWDTSSQRFQTGRAGFSVLPPWNKIPMTNWKLAYYAILFSCFPYLGRSIYRLCEFSQTHEHPFHNTDLSLFLFDGVRLSLTIVPLLIGLQLPLFAGIFVFIIIWPPRFMKFPQAFAGGGMQMQGRGY